MFLFYLLFPYFLSFSLQSDTFCHRYHSCFSCNWQFNCKWSSNECLPLNESKNDTNWLLSIDSCNKSNTNDSITHYKIPFMINFTFPSSKENINETQFYKWNINEIDPNRILKLTLSNNINKYSTDIAIVLTLSDNTIILYRTASYDTFNIIYQEVKSVHLFLLSENSLYTNNSNYNIISHRYNQSLTFEGKYSSISRKKLFGIIFFISVTVLLLTSLLLFIYFKIIKKKKNIFESTERSECAILFNKKILESVLVKKIYEEEKEEKCTVCCELIKKGNCVSVLECKHIFHYQCIYHWGIETIKHPTCPNCKKDIIKSNKSSEKIDKILTINVTNQETV